MTLIMKKIILTILPALLFTASIYGQSRNNSAQAVAVTGIEFVRIEDQVTLTFNLRAGRKATKSDHNLVINPILSGKGGSIQLPLIMIEGKRMKVTEERHRLGTGYGTEEHRSFYTRNGGVVRYSATFSYEDWMRGANLYLNGVSVGCCSVTETKIGLIAENVLWSESRTEIQIVEVPIEIEAESQKTVAEKLANQYSFIVPVSEFEKAREYPSGTLFNYNLPLNLGKGLSASHQNEVERFIDITREGSISIYFRQGSRIIDRGFSGNNKSLVELISAIRAITESNDSKVVRIVIAGFASPEGSLAFNDRLAWDRAVAVKTFLTTNSSIQPSQVQIYNGSVDWTGLRQLVAQSDMYDKHRIIDIIDNMPIWDSWASRGRHGELMRLSGGNSYRYMLREFFPQLRQAAYIKVYYENK